jgi:hypothetical protein
MTFVETLSVTQDVAYAKLKSVAELDFKSPFDELRELRAVLTTQQIAELTGLRRETISRARPDSRFRRSTEKALGDLHAVVTRMRSADGGDLGQLAAILRRPQPLLDGRSIAELLREGKVDVVLAHLSPSAPSDPDAPPAPPGVEQLEDLRLDSETLAALGSSSTASTASRSGSDGRRVVEHLDADPALAARLPEIESRIRDHFGADARIERAVVSDPEDGDGRDRLYLRIGTDLSVDEEVERLTALLDREEGRLRPFQERLTIGIS